MDLSLEEIEQRFKSGNLSESEAINYLNFHFRGRNKIKAQNLLDKILGMPSELKDVSKEQKELMKMWWENNHG